MTPIITYKHLLKRFGKKHADLVRRQLIQASKESEAQVPPSGGWCNSCERYDCGHHTLDGMVISPARDHFLVTGHWPNTISL